ncbi:MAG: HD domain-containing protein [Candidatus Liptonbacteria bacterium]|nr:HD domain-containing protein [Candidatus Liptonbacteria bacterium]
MSIETLIKKYTELLTMVIRDHEKVRASESGHDFEHALMVANYSVRIADDARTAKLAWVAGICHNTDHLIERGLVPEHFRKKHTLDTLVRKKLIQYLQYTTLNHNDKQLVIEAVMEHRKRNDPRDSKVTVALKDADRLANVGALLCLRSAKELEHLPVLDYIHLFHHPSSSYRHPESVGKDISYSLEWKKWLRLPKAKKIGAKRFAFLKIFMQDIENQLKESRLRPYPFSRKKN